MEDSVTLAWKHYEKDHNGQAFLYAVSRVLYLGFQLPYYRAAVLHDMGRRFDFFITTTEKFITTFSKVSKGYKK